MQERHRLDYNSPALKDEDSFRLLKLCPGPRIAKSNVGRCAIKTEIEVHRLSACPEYVALSYSWGEQVRFEDIGVGDLAYLPVSTPLMNGLRQMRHPDPDAPTYACIDAVCINQNNSDEPSSRVKMIDDAAYLHGPQGLFSPGSARPI
ncbi:Hypothetical predicted protein [Lecanosticta acicola]|uniref:Heterokaryon incompatibility domain-containing protein n=1 Tax=Lecanosticta acicola TaxID=111012 RepID=A0AAI9E7R1_9PEZI|nr:Hypothetical predicted protein [Lecanosticta acicola]